MDFDLKAAVTFVATHARILERRRLDLMLGDGTPENVFAALDAYRNPDGGYGWGLEPDLRSAISQPVAAMHALELLADIRDAKTRRPVEILDWLAGQTFDDGGVPVALAYTDTEGSAPHWADANPSESSLQMTTQLAAQAHRLARHRADIAGHAWLAGATQYCLTAIAETLQKPQAYELMFVMRFLDAVADHDPRALPLIEHFAKLVRTDRPTPVQGGAEDEVLHLLDFTPYATHRCAPLSRPPPSPRTCGASPRSSSPMVAGPSTTRFTARPPCSTGGATRPSSHYASSGAARCEYPTPPSVVSAANRPDPSTSVGFWGDQPVTYR